jgi:hypothetical protein
VHWSVGKMAVHKTSKVGAMKVRYSILHFLTVILVASVVPSNGELESTFSDKWLSVSFMTLLI